MMATMTAKLIAFSGVPGSGKSTLAEELIGKLRAEGNRAIRVNRDDIRTLLFGAAYHDGAPVGAAEKQVSSYQQLTINHFLSQGWHVISDDTNIGKGALSGLKKLAESHGADFEHHLVHVDLEVALDRNKERGESGGRRVPNFVIISMWNRQKELIGTPGAEYTKVLTKTVQN